MARLIFPSSFKCDCGHQSDFFENTVRQLGELSRRSRKAQVLSDTETNRHRIVFLDGRADTVICPDLGECKITDDLDTTIAVPPRKRVARPTPAPLKFTPTQGRYLAFIDHYTKVHDAAPAEADMLAYFRTSPPSVHQMVVTLERNKLIARTPGQAQSIRVLVPPESVPDLKTGTVATPTDRYPNVAAWMKRNNCSIELGYDPKTDTFARAITKGDTLWCGGEPSDTLDGLLAALDGAIASLKKLPNTQS
jgi:hypothetical protein